MALPGGSPPAATGCGPRPEFVKLMESARASLEIGRYNETQLQLTPFYHQAGLAPDESRQIIEILDQVAGTLIYSRQHLLEPPYRVLPGDTLKSIGDAYNVPGELLGKINGIHDPQQLRPGTELKVLRGPFDAAVDLGRYELTLFLKGRYAGRFPLGIGRDYPPAEGTFSVKDKKLSPRYYGPQQPIEANDPANPLGKRLLELASQTSPSSLVAIHGTNDPRGIGRGDGKGCIFLSDRDIDDVFDILSIGSTVTIRRGGALNDKSAGPGTQAAPPNPAAAPYGQDARAQFTLPQSSSSPVAPASPYSQLIPPFSTQR